MEPNSADAEDLDSGWLEVKKRHRSNSKFSVPRSTAASRGLPESLRKVQSEPTRDQSFVSGQIAQRSSNKSSSPGSSFRVENRERNVNEMKSMSENRHLELGDQGRNLPDMDEKVAKQTVEEHSLQFGGIKPPMTTMHYLEKPEPLDMTSLRKHITEGFVRDSSSVIDNDKEISNPSIVSLSQVAKIKWGNLDEAELEQTQEMEMVNELANPQNSHCSSIVKDKIPLAGDSAFVADEKQTSVIDDSLRAGEVKEEIGIADLSNSDVLQRVSERSNSTESSYDIIEGSEIFVHQLNHKSAFGTNMSRVQGSSSVQNEFVQADECESGTLLALEESEEICFQEPNNSCTNIPKDSLATTSDKISFEGVIPQESTSLMDHKHSLAGKNILPECTDSSKAELIAVAGDEEKSEEVGEIANPNGVVNREKLNEDMNIAASMLSAFGKGETGESKERFRQRLWCFLFENLNRAVDELYLLCELECDVEQMKEAIIVLDEAQSDFKELKSRVEEFEEVKKLSSISQPLSSGSLVNAKLEHRRRHALSWEVRRMASSPRRAEILSSSLEAFKRIQQETASKSMACQDKRRDPVYPNLPQNCKENVPGKSLCGHVLVPTSKEVGGKLKGKQGHNSESGNRGSIGDKRHTEVMKANKECSLSSDVRMAQRTSNFSSPQLQGKDGCVPNSNPLGSSCKIDHVGRLSEMDPASARRLKIPSCETRVDKNNKAVDSLRRQVSVVDKEKDKKSLVMRTSLDAWKEKRNWEDILASPLRAASGTSHSPIVSRKSTERVRVLHDKLMSPERRKKSLLDMKKEVDEKHARATRIRRELENERVQRLQRASEKLNRVNEWQAVRSSKLREGMYARQQRGESRHEAYLAQIARRASDESSKVSEVRFITSLNEENKKLSLRQKLQDSELRRAERLQIIKIKQKEDIAREEAVLERRKLLEAEKLQRLAETQRKKEEAQARREEERKAASAAREAKAVEQVRKKEVRAKAKQEEAELQAQKLAERLSESELRRKMYLEQIREKAAMDFREQPSPSSRRPSSRDGQLKSVANQAVEGYLANAITRLPGFASKSCRSCSQQQSLKKRIKKIRQRLMAQKYEFSEPPIGVESAGLGSLSVAGAARLKVGRWLQELQRLQQARKAGAASIGLIIGEMIKHLDGKEAELHAARQAGLLDFIASALPASHTSKPEPCQTTISLLRILRVVLKLPANCSYFLARNLLPPLIPMLSAALENYNTMAASHNGGYGGGRNSTTTSADKILNEKLETVGEVLEGLLWSVASIVGHACTDERQLQMQDDLAELIVACQVIHHLRDLFSLFDRPQTEGAPFPAPVLLGLDILRVLTCPRGNISSMDWETHSSRTVTVPGPQPSEFPNYEGNVVSLFGSSSNKFSEKEGGFHVSLPALVEHDLGCNKIDVMEEVPDKEKHDRLENDVHRDVEDAEQVQSTCSNKAEVRQEDGIGRECRESFILQMTEEEKPIKERIAESNKPISARNKSKMVRGFLVSVIAETGLVGVPSLLTSVLLQANPRATSEQVAYTLPLNFEEVATGVLKILNNLARLDVTLVQSMLARPDLQMEFFHLMSFLLSHCTCKWKNATDQVAFLLFETLLLLGYFALLHSGNQAVLRWGKSPTILHKICDLPFAFFSDPRLTPVLVGTLLAVCYGCEQNRDVVRQELSMEMLLVLLKSSKQEFVTSDSKQTLVPRVGVQTDQSNSVSYQSGTMDVIAEESEEEMKSVQAKDLAMVSQEALTKQSGDSPAVDVPCNSPQQLNGRPSKPNLTNSDHTNSLKKSNKTITKTVSQAESLVKESVVIKTSNLGKVVKGKTISSNKEVLTSQSKGCKVSYPDSAQKFPNPVSSKRGISAALPDHIHNLSTGIHTEDPMCARQFQGNSLLSPTFTLGSRFPVDLLDHAQEFFAAGLE